MAMVNDRTTLNDMDTQADADQWTSPAFDAIGLNDTNSPTRIYREGGGSGNMIIKGGTDSYWYDNMTFDLTGAIRTGKFKVLVMWLWFSGPASTDNMSDILIGMYDGTNGQGGAGNGGRWHYKPIIEAQNTWGWIPAMAYPTQPDETSGTFASLVESSMDSIELDVNNGTNDVKLAGIEACFIISYIGGHSQTVTFQNLVDHSEDKTNDRDFGVAAKLDANGNIFKFRVSLRLGDAAATATTTFSESDKTVLFDNVNTDHEIGYDLINDTGGDLLVFSPSGVTHIWNDGNSELWTGEAHADTWTPEACTWVNGGGGAVLPAHATGKTTNNHTFKNCGSIDIGDAVCEGCSFSGANTDPAVIYVGSGTRRIKNSRYTGRAIAVSFDTAQTITMDGDTFSGNTYDIENAGSIVLADSYAGPGDGGWNSSSTYSRRAQSFTGNGGLLTRAKLTLRKTGTPTGFNLVVKLYAHSGTFGTTSVPTGTALDTSIDVVDVATLPLTDTTYQFEFTGGVTLVNGTYYCLAIEGQTTITPDAWFVERDNSVPTHAGNGSRYDTAWGASAADAIFEVYTGGGALTADSYVQANQNATTALAGTLTSVGQAITGDGGTLSNVRWYLSKTGSPTGNAVCKLYAHSGTFGTSSIPTGTPLATSVNVDVSLISGTLELTQFQFEDQYILIDATNYVIVLEYTGDASNYISAGTDTTTPTHGGNFSTLIGTWAAVAGTDAIFYVSTGGILIINATNGANPSTYLNSATVPGAVIVQNAVTVKITAVTITNTPIQDVRIYLKTDPGGIVILNGLTDVNGEISAAYNYSSDQNVIGWARKSTTTPLYKEAPLVGTITSAGLNAAATMILDE